MEKAIRPNSTIGSPTVEYNPIMIGRIRVTVIIADDYDSMASTSTIPGVTTIIVRIPNTIFILSPKTIKGIPVSVRRQPEGIPDWFILIEDVFDVGNGRSLEDSGGCNSLW